MFMDYKKIGLKVGIEIHQRLATEHRLFCRCPAALSEAVVTEVKRRQRAIAGEMGSVDPATLFEYFRNRKFYYEATDKNCIIELDYDFPRPANQEALSMALQMALMLRMQVPDELHVMRKIVTDGSNTTGYQRTILVGIGTERSVVQTKSGTVRVKTLQLEEESAGIIGEENGKIRYRLDRLGIPLIEIGTEADIKSPEQAQELAEYIGKLLRSFSVMRGIGTIRQDVNVSIKDGARVEIKGFQDLRSIAQLVENEVQRQLALVEIKKELQKRKAKIGKPQDVTHVFRETHCNFIKRITDNSGIVLALKLDGFAGLMKTPCGGKTFGKEMAYYVMPHGPKGIVDTDEDISAYNLTKEFNALSKEMKKGDKDLILIIADVKEQAEKAVAALSRRLDFCFKGVPEETRVALPDATTKYTRPLPGAGRMYPETDLPCIKITKEMLKEARKMPETVFEKEKQLKKELPEELACQLVASHSLALYERLKKYGTVMVASTLLSTLKDLKRQGVNVDKIREEHLEELFAAVKKGAISKDIIPAALERLSHGKHMKDIEKEFGILSNAELLKIVQVIVKENKGLSEKALMGLVMARVKGRASGRDVADMLKKLC